MTIPLIVIGWVLEKNPDWFNGAHTVGAGMFWVGIAGLVIQIALFALVTIGLTR